MAQEQTLRRSTRSRKASDLFDHHVMVAVEDPVPLEAMESSDRQHWRQAITEKLECLEDSATWAKGVLPHGKTAIPCKMEMERKIGKCMGIASYMT